MLDEAIGINSDLGMIQLRIYFQFALTQNSDNNCDLIIFSSEEVNPNAPDGQNVQLVSEIVPYTPENFQFNDCVYTFLCLKLY